MLNGSIIVAQRSSSHGMLNGLILLHRFMAYIANHLGREVYQKTFFQVNF